MKKTLLTALAATAITTGAFAQGSLNFTDANINPGVATDNATAWVTGSVTFSIWWLAGTANTSIVNAINAADLAGNGGTTAAQLTADGFTSEVSGLVASVSGGTFTYNVAGVALPNIPTSTQNTFAILASFGSLTGSIAFVNGDGGSLSAVPAGTPANLDGWNALGQNLVLSTPVPEPTTMALAGLGSLSLFLFRRRK